MVTAVAGMVAPVPVVVAFRFSGGLPTSTEVQFSNVEVDSLQIVSRGALLCLSDRGAPLRQNMKSCVHSCFQGSAPVFFSLHPDDSGAFSRHIRSLWGLRWTLLDLAWSLMGFSWASVGQSWGGLQHCNSEKI